MRKNILKFIIIFSLIFNISNSEVSAQNLDGLGKLIKILEQAPDKISGEKLEKLLIENHILVYETVRYEKQSSYQYHAEWSFNKDKTYTVIDKNNYRYNNSSIKHPAKGRWELAGLGNSSVRLDDASNTRFQISFSEDGNIYAGSEKIYSYRLENIQEKINREAKIAEEKRIAEELRLKKIEEEKRQLAIKREQIKKEEERKRLELAEWAKKEEEEKIKRDNEERIKLEREELYKNILKYSLFLIVIAITASVIYYIYKFHKNKAKILFLNLQNSFKNKSFDKKFLNKILNKFTTLRELISSPYQSLNLKDFNISKSTIFKMINYNTFKIKFKKKILKEEFFEFLNKNLENKLQWRCSALDSQVFQFNILNSFFRYQWGNNYKYAEEISNLVNKKFSSLESLTNDEIFEFKSLLSEKLKDNGKITITNKIVLWIGIPFIGLILWSNINSSTTTNELCKCPCYQTLNIPHTYYDPKTGNYTHTPQYHNFLRDHCK